MARSTIRSCSADTVPSRCAAARFGSTGSKDSPSVAVRVPTAAAARTRAAASGRGQQQPAGQQHRQGGEAVRPRQISGFRISDQPVVDQRQPAAESLELLPKADLLSRIELIKTAALDRVEEFGIHVVESVQDHIQRGALSAFSHIVIPELHASILFEDVFDSKFFQQNKGNLGYAPALDRSSNLRQTPQPSLTDLLILNFRTCSGRPQEPHRPQPESRLAAGHP
jgi:hypothetical protein